MEKKICTHFNIEKKTLKLFTTIIQNVKFVKIIEVKNITMNEKIDYQIGEKYILERNEIN